MILPDVNVLLYAFLRRLPEHAAYAQWLGEARETTELALVQTVLLGVVRVASNSTMTTNPAPTGLALRFVEDLRASRGARTLDPTNRTWECLQALVDRDRGIRGNLVPDAWLAALAISHGARLATADRGFGRFDGLDFFDPVSV